jgi:hypothetical protein
MPCQRHILAHDVLTIQWTATYDWQGLADQAWALEPDHRTLGRETIKVRAFQHQFNRAGGRTSNVVAENIWKSHLQCGPIGLQ